MAFATVAATATTAIGTATAAPVVDLPAGIAAGDTLLGIYRAAGAGAITFPAGWNELINGDLGGSDDNIAIFWRKATGAEGATITLGSGVVKGAWLCRRYEGAADPTVTPPEIQTNDASNATPNPPSLTAALGAQDYLWEAIATCAGSPTVTAFPTGYVNPESISSDTAGASGTRATVAAASRELNAASEDPGTFTLSAAQNWFTATVLIHPTQTSSSDETSGAVPTATDDAGNWTIVGGAASHHASLTDGNPSTGIQSPDSPVDEAITFSLSDLGVPASGLVVFEIDAVQV